MQLLINDFVTGNLKIDKNRICLAPKEGGIGMINISNYINGLHCSWIKRAQLHRIDNWRADLHAITGGKPIDVNPKNLDKKSHPILHTLAVSWWTFKRKFLSKGKNFFKSTPENNPVLVNNKREKMPWDIRDIVPNGTVLNAVRISDCTDNGLQFKTRLEMSNQFGLVLSAAEYNSFKTAVSDSWNLIKKFSTDDECIDILEFLSRFKKGSKPFRKILDYYDEILMSGRQNRRINTFFNLINIPKPDKLFIAHLLKEWSMNFYPTQLRDFIFKFRFNILGLNTRVAHFNQNVNRACTFCAGTPDPRPAPVRLPVLPDESFSHLFFDCPITNRVLRSFNNEFLNNLDDQNLKKFVFTGILPNSQTPNRFLMTIATSINYYTWQCKLQKKSPSIEGLKNDLFYGVENILRSNRQIRLDMINDLPLCRSWHNEAGRRC
jgi:hypothetical protein